MPKFLLLFWTITLFSCAPQSNGQANLDDAQLEQMLKTDKNVQLVDVRTPGEWQQTGIIAGAKKMNINAPDFADKVATLDKNRPVVLYCAAGGRSAHAMNQLSQMGFKKVYNYMGGMTDWKAKGKPTVSAQ